MNWTKPIQIQHHYTFGATTVTVKSVYMIGPSQLSPTSSLDEVFFPSLVVCNLNTLRKSFIFALIEDPEIKKLEVTFHGDRFSIFFNFPTSNREAFTIVNNIHEPSP